MKLSKLESEHFLFLLSLSRSPRRRVLSKFLHCDNIVEAECKQRTEHTPATEIIGKEVNLK